jgi:hypothetical protein
VSAAVEVIVDPDDDIATVTAVRELAARDPGLLAISIGPRLRSDTEVIWAILRALGKRVEHLRRSSGKVWWIDAEKWLTAHRIIEIVVLYPQHLGDRRLDELNARLRALEIALTLVYGGPARVRTAATTNLGPYLTRQRDPLRRHSEHESWPRVPRSHPLRFRYDCWRALEPDEFARVERLLCDSMITLGGWCWAMEPSTQDAIERAVRLVSAAPDPEQAYIRQCGPELALIEHQIPIPRATPLALTPCATTAEQIETIHVYTDPATAGYHLAKLITGLPDRLLAMIGRDQISDDAILECIVPEVARPILRAIEDKNHWPVLAVPYYTLPEPGADSASEDVTREEQARPNDEFATALGSLLHGRSERIPAIKLSRRARSQFEALRANGILDRRHSVYRASHIALYSWFRADSTLIRALTNDWDDLLTTRGNPADI